jgi:peptidoglycan/LPS O-acetylase OafA/YrhL
MPKVLLGFGVAWALLAGFLDVQSPLALFENNWLRVLSLGPAWAFIVWGMVGLEADRGYVPLKTLSGLGDSSYALYLIHVPIFAASARLIAPFCGSGAWDNVISWFGLLTIAITTALLVHRLIERPILKRLTKLRCKFLPTGSALMPSPPPSLGNKK